MRAILDTHTYLWSLVDPDRLGPRARHTLSMQSTEIFVSVASHWELAIKEGRRGLRLRISLERLFTTEMEESGYALLPIERNHILQVKRLSYPSNGHADPFDRMLVAQALADDLELLSADAKLDVYGVRRVW